MIVLLYYFTFITFTACSFILYDRQVILEMVGCFAATPKNLAMAIACSLSGAVLLALGTHLSYVNVEPQRARTLACDKLVLDTLRKKFGYIPPSEVRRMASSNSNKEHN